MIQCFFLFTFQFITSVAYDSCVTNQSYNRQNLLRQLQRRENLIKLDLESAYMTRNGGNYDGDNSAGCSNQSSPVDDQGKSNCFIKKVF